MSKTIKWVLALSLLLNIVLIGFGLGCASNMPEAPGMHKMGKNIDGLDPEKQKMVDDIWANFREANKERFQEIQQARQDIVAIMEAPDFDEKAFRDKSAELSALMVESKKLMMETMATVAKQFNQDERKALAHHMRRPPMGPPDR